MQRQETFTEPKKNLRIDQNLEQFNIGGLTKYYE